MILIVIIFSIEDWGWLVLNMRWPPPWLSVQGDLLHSVDCLYKVPPDSPTGQSVGVRPLKWTVGSRRAMWRRESDEAPNMINCRGLVLLSVLSLRNIVSIELESLDFPSYIIAGDSAVMSCLYKVSQVQESELDIKWYHGTSPSPFLVINNIYRAGKISNRSASKLSHFPTLYQRDICKSKSFWYFGSLKVHHEEDVTCIVWLTFTRCTCPTTGRLLTS